MHEISGFTDYFNQFVKLIIVIGSISHTGEITATGDIPVIGVITMTGTISQDNDGP